MLSLVLFLSVYTSDLDSGAGSIREFRGSGGSYTLAPPQPYIRYQTSPTRSYQPQLRVTPQPQYRIIPYQPQYQSQYRVPMHWHDNFGYIHEPNPRAVPTWKYKNR